MEKIKYLVISLFACFFFIGQSLAQQDFTLYNMDAVPQRIYSNPALFPSSRMNYNLPLISSIYLNISNSGFKYSDLIKKGSDDSLHIDFDNMLGKLADDNYLSTALHIDLLSIGIKIKKNYFSVNATEKINSRFRYPKGLLEMVQKGNGALLDKKIDFNFGLNLTHYREYGFGYAREINDKLTIGGRFKYLYGMENVSVEKSDISLTTSPDYNFPITIKSDVLVNTAGLDSNSFSDFNVTDYAFKKKNKGLGVDLGAAYKLNGKFSFSASIIDLGSIKWKTEVSNFKSLNPEAAFTYNGVEFNNFLGDTTATDNPFTKLLDSLTTTFNLDSTYESYSTGLPAQIYLGGNYHINDKNKAGILLYGQFFDKKIHPALALSYNVNVGKWLTASATYSMLNRSYNNIGLGLAINVVNVQIYITEDNVLGSFFPQNTKNVHLHLGFNITLGREPLDKDDDGIPDRNDACPDIVGFKEFNGCPDRDGDHIPDADDACPDKPGLPQFKGCPDKDGDGVIDYEDACPDEPGLPEFKGCPDKDGDKIIDKEDECLDESGLPELKGCPDKDGDGIKDSEDKCPDKAGPAENNGCPLVKLFMLDKNGNVIASTSKNQEGSFVFKKLPPDEAIMFRLEGDDTGLLISVNVILDGSAKKAVKDKDGYFRFEQLNADVNKLKLMEEKDVPLKLKKEEEEIINKAFKNLEFNPGKDIIKFDSYASLEELGKLLIKKSTWKLKLSGHTDNVGSNEVNMTLSKKRTEAVKKFLVDRGLQADRVIVKYFGATQPVADNTTPEGKQKNRRVEMLIVE